jgi:hypothetical protein
MIGGRKTVEIKASVIVKNLKTLKNTPINSIHKNLLKKPQKKIMTVPSIILSAIATISLTVYIWFTEYRLHLMRKKLLEHHRKFYSADKDIRTLHGNQKLLHSSIKELHKDLRIYGEVKKSRVKTFSQAEAREEGTGTI